MPNLLTHLKIAEVSSVPRGAGHGVRVLLSKMDAGDKSLSATTAMATIMKHAIDFGADDAAVRHAGSVLGKVAGNIESRPEADQSPAIQKALEQCVEHIAGLVPTEKRDAFLAASAAVPTVKGETTMTPEDKARFDALEKQNKELMTSVSTLTLKAALADLPAEQKAYVSSLKKADDSIDDAAVAAFVKMSPEDKAKAMADAKAKKDRESGDFTKALDEQIRTNPVVKSLSDQLAISNGKLSEFEKANEEKAFAKRATDLGLPEAHGAVMRKAYAGDQEAIKKHEEMLAALAKQGATGALFAEFGSSVQKTGVTAYEEIRQKAADMQKALAAKGETKSIQQCVSKVMNDPENRDLVARNRMEGLQKMGAVRAA